MTKRPHFDAAALIEHVYAQPIGLIVSTSHPPGFRRLLYLEARRKPQTDEGRSRKVQILQSPDSSHKFYLARDDVDLSAVVEEHNASESTDE